MTTRFFTFPLRFLYSSVGLSSPFTIATCSSYLDARKEYFGAINGPSNNTSVVVREPLVI